MCEHEHEHERGSERGYERGGEFGRRHGHHRGPGFRGFGRRGFPTREQWLERLQAHEQRLASDLENVRDLIQRLGSDQPPQQPPAEI